MVIEMDNQRQNVSSLSVKIILLCGLVALAGMVGVIWMNTLHAQTQAFRTAEMQLQRDSRTISAQFDRAVHTLSTDVELLSLSPEIRSLVQDISSRDTMPSAQELESARAKTEELFRNVMTLHPEFMQLRLVSLSAKGEELVRVNRVGDDIETVASGGLQDKGREPYIQLARSMTENKAIFSRVSYNREFGRVDETRTPVVRAIAPVMFEDGQMVRAVVIINANYKSILESSLAALPLQSDVIIANDAGDAFCYDADKKTGEFFLAYEVPEKLGKTISSLWSVERQSLFKLDDRYYFATENTHDNSNSPSNISIYQSVPHGFIFSEVVSHFVESATFIGVMMASLLALATFSANRLTLPLRRMATAIRRFQLTKNAEMLDLPYNREDEVGELSNSFRTVLKELERERHQKDNFFEHGVDAFAVLDANGVILTNNQACERLFGYAKNELMGQNVKILMPEKYARHHDHYLRNFKHNGETKVVGIGRDVEGLRKDGTTFPIGLAISHFQQDGQTYLCGTIRDITKRKQNERMKDEFVSTVNHELRTPLTSIYGSLDLLRRISEGKLDDRCKRLLTLAFDGCSRLTHLVNDILDLEKISAGKMEYRMEKRPIQSLVSEIVCNNESLADKFETQFQVRHRTNDAIIEVDPNRFGQALLNLLSNAAKFTSRHSVIQIETKCLPDNTVRVSVTDNGPGIPVEFRSRIFEKFAQANGTAVSKTPGSGLGLNITKQIILAFGGDVWFETEMGQGTTFHIDLPICADVKVPQQVA